MPLPRIYEAEVCPYCGSNDIDYEDSNLFGEEYVYSFKCNDCNRRSTEVYEMKFKFVEGEDYA